MTKILYVQSSPREDESESAALADQFLAAFTSAQPRTEVDTLDLWQEPLPIFGGNKARAKMTVITGQQLEGVQRTAWDEIEEAFARFSRADLYLFTVPMWNAGVPWVLKHYIDTLTQPGLAFGFDPASGYSGLLEGKTAVAVYTSGVYRAGIDKAFGSDFHSTFFDDWLRFCGIDDIHEIRFQPTLVTADLDREREDARKQAVTLATQLARGRQLSAA